jgi:hypothetical protein
MSSSNLPAPADDSDDILEVGPPVRSDDDIPQAGSVALSGRALLKSLLWRWLVATPLGLLVAAIAAVAVWVYLPPSPHVVYIKLYMPVHPEGNVLQHPEAGIDFELFQRTQFAMLRSHSLLDAVLWDPKVQQLDLREVTKGITPVDWLEKQITIDLPDGPELPRVALSGDDPERLKTLVTAVRDTYLEVVATQTNLRRQGRMDRLKKLRDMYEARVKGVKDANRILPQFRWENPKIEGIDPGLVELKQELCQRQLEAAKAQLIDTRGKLTEMNVQAKLAAYKVKTANGQQIPDKDIEAQVDKSLAKDLEGLNKLQADLVKARAVSSGGDSDAGMIRRIASALEEKTAAIDAKRETLRRRYREELRQKAQSEAQADLVQIREKIKYHEELEKALDEEATRLTRLNDKVNVKVNVKPLDLGVDLAGGDAGVDRAEANKVEFQLSQEGYQRVVKEIDALQMEMPSPPRVRKWEDAVVVAPDDTPRKLKAATLAGLGAFAIVLLLATFVGFTRRRSRTA